jgi:hypothetical protein
LPSAVMGRRFVNDQWSELSLTIRELDNFGTSIWYALCTDVVHMSCTTIPHIFRESSA